MRSFLIASFLLLVALGLWAEVAPLAESDKRIFADALFSRSLFSAALPEYEALSRANLEDGDVILFRLADCQRHVGKLEDAVKTISRIESEYESSKYLGRARILKGLVLIDLERPLAAASVLDRVATLPDQEPISVMMALYRAGEAYEKEGNSTSKAQMRYRALLRKVLPEGASAEDCATAKELMAYAALRLAILDVEADSKGAMEQFAQIVKNPYNSRVGAEALFRMANIDYREGRYVAAIDNFKELRTKYASDVRSNDCLVTLTWAYYRVQRFADAAEMAKEIIEKEPSGRIHSEAAYLRAISLSQLDERDDAISAYDYYISLPAVDTAEAARKKEAEYQRLQVLLKSGEYERLLSDGDKIRDIPDDLLPEYYWLMALAADALQDDARTVQYYRLIVNKCPNSKVATEAAYRLGYRLQKDGRYVEASAAYLVIANNFKDSPFAPQALYSSGICLYRVKKYEEAIRDFSTLLSLYPDDKAASDGAFQKAMAEIQLDSKRDAADTLDGIFAKYKDSKRYYEAKFWRARLFYEKGEYKDAEAALVESLKGAGSDIREEASYLLGLCYQAEGRLDEAAIAFQPLLSVAVRSKFSVTRLAWLTEFQLKRGEYFAAKEAANELIARVSAPDAREAGYTLLGHAEECLGNYKEAIVAYTNAVSFGSHTKYRADAELSAAKLYIRSGELGENVRELLNMAIQDASSKELSHTRAESYLTLARFYKARHDNANAVRYYMAVWTLFDDKSIVPMALKESIPLLRELGREDDARAAENDLHTRYLEENDK